MATIIVEDGTIVANANSYLSEAELTTYATDRGITISGTNAILLIKGMDYIENLMFKGWKQTENQALVWPRYDVMVDGYWLDLNTIPQLLKDGVAEVALDIDRGLSPTADLVRSTKKEKLEGLEIEYMDNASSVDISRKINTKLRKLLDDGNNGTVVRIRRR